MNILLLGSYGRGNLGDDALLIAAIDILNGHQITSNAAPDAPLPPEVLKNIQIISTTSHHDTLTKIRSFLSARAIVYGGGALWVILPESRIKSISILKMALLNLLSRMMFKRVVYLGCDTGELSGYSLFLAKFSARLANLIILRNQHAKDLLGISRSIVLPDLTATIFENKELAMSKISRAKIKIVVSVLYYIPNSETQFNVYTNQMAAAINSLDSKVFSVILLPLFVTESTNRNDVWASKELLKRITTGIAKIIVPSDFDEYIRVINEADIMVGTRLHACLLSIWLGKATIGITYRPKVKNFFHDNNLDDLYIELDEITEQLPQKIKMVHDNYDSVVAKIHDVAVRNKMESRQYKVLTRKLFGNA